jgi:hypothetical protein
VRSTPNSPSIKERDSSGRFTASQHIISLLSKAYDRLKLLVHSQRAVWRVVAALGEEYMSVKQYEKAKQ